MCLPGIFHGRIMKKALISLLWGFIFSIFILLPAMEVKAGDFYYPPDDDGRLIVVLDPGHGGSNLGADYNGFVEKEMNLVVAKAMAEELRKYCTERFSANVIIKKIINVYKEVIK